MLLSYSLSPIEQKVPFWTFANEKSFFKPPKFRSLLFSRASVVFRSTLHRSACLALSLSWEQQCQYVSVLAFRCCLLDHRSLLLMRQLILLVARIIDMYSYLRTEDIYGKILRTFTVYVYTSALLARIRQRTYCSDYSYE